jgi:diacylglycerol kinase (ATP)
MNEHKNYPQSISLSGLVKSFKNAFNGFRVLLRHEYNLYIQIALGIAATILGFYFDISSVEWMVQSTAIGLVIFSELVNTAVEKIMDLLHPQHDQRVKDIKDMAAASVLFTVAIAVTVGCIIYIPRIFG